MGFNEVTELTVGLYRDALRDGWIPVAVCRTCENQQTIPAETCFECGATNPRLVKHPGSGRVFSWVVCHYAFSEEWGEDVPYVVLLVELDGGARAYGRLEQSGDGSVQVYPEMEIELDVGLTKARSYPVFRATSRAHSKRSTSLEE